MSLYKKLSERALGYITLPVQVYKSEKKFLLTLSLGDRGLCLEHHLTSFTEYL